jgi:hypothetical protein
MSLQNRVDPWGAINRSHAGGTLMSNRGGALHNEQREILCPFKNRRWITCLLAFKGRKRSVMSPRRYTELFFLDEAVALAAGHRPCAECRWERFHAFKDSWMRREEVDLSVPLRAADIDAELHNARGDRGRKVTYEAILKELPNGSFIELDGSAYLVWNDALLLWTPERYSRKEPRPNDLTVTVLTPQPTVQCLRQGYEPEAHESVDAF